LKGRLRPIDYIGWAQADDGGARWDLTASGVPDTYGSASLTAREPDSPAGPEWDLFGHPTPPEGFSLADLSRRDLRPQIVASFLRRSRSDTAWLPNV
jgi:hypothetical protein